MIDPFLVAVRGVGPDPLAFATDGFLFSVQVQPQPIVPVAKKRPKQKKAPHNTPSGGNAIFLSDVISPTWIPYEEEEKAADFALIHAPEPTAVIKALVDGVAETFLDDKGRRSIVLIGSDGTRYWHVDVGEALIEDGARVLAGAPIGRTKQGAPSLPSRVVRALPQGGEEPTERPRPVQPVFVDPPPSPTPAPKQFVILVPIRRIARLVPIQPPPVVFLGETVRAPERAPPVGGVVFSIAAIAAAVYALSSQRRKRRRRRS